MAVDPDKVICEWTRGEGYAPCGHVGIGPHVHSADKLSRANDNEGPFSIGQHLWPGIAKLIEECGEVTQVAGKLIATGGRTDHWSGHNLADDLMEELGDLSAAIQFVLQYNAELDTQVVFDRIQCKFALFEEWHGRGEL